MTSEAFVVHRTAERVRLKVPALKGDAASLSRLRDSLAAEPGIFRVETSPVTASVLLHCRVSSEHVLDCLRRGHLLSLREPAPVRRPLAVRTVAGFREIDTWVERVTMGELDLPSLALVGLIATGIYQVARGNLAIPAWYTALWYAASIALKAVPQDEKQGLM